MLWNNPRNGVVTTEQLLQAYASLDPSNSVECDQFFEDFGAGNVASPVSPEAIILSKPYERLFFYEHMLNQLVISDQNKYRAAHKGVPFYYISWLAFTIKDFEKAVFYMDAAISEDIRVSTRMGDPVGWQTTPAAKFLFLDSDPRLQVASAITLDLSKQFEQQLSRFNENLGSQLTLQVLRERFVTSHISNHSFRSIISGLYVFVAEYAERIRQMRLRSSDGGSIEPFLVHLFKGCLIFESLLKTEYGGGARNTLSAYLGEQSAMSCLEIGQPPYPRPVYKRDKPRGEYTLPFVIEQLSIWRTEAYQEKITAVAYGVRNTAGHDLSWPDLFDEGVYKELFESIMDSILWFIWKVEI